MTACATVRRTDPGPPVDGMVMTVLRIEGRGLPGPAVEDDGLGLGHLGDGGPRALLADPAALEPAVGHQVGPPERRPVDVDVPGVDLPDRADRAGDVTGEDARAEAERGPVGLRDRRVPVRG